VPFQRKRHIWAANRSIVAGMRQLLVIISAAALLAVGTAIAVAGGGGSTWHGNASYHQYHPKPPCPPEKPDYSHKWRSSSNKWHGSGYPLPPPKDKGKCPKPPDCDHRYDNRIRWSSKGHDKCDGHPHEYGKGHYDDGHYGHGHDHDDHDHSKPGKGKGGHH